MINTNKTMQSIAFPLLAIIFVFLLTFALAGYSAAPWLPTTNKNIEAIIKSAAIKDGDIVYDLGCGDGRFLFTLARRYNIQGIGLEISLGPYLAAKIRTLFNKRVEIKYKNLFNENLSQADVIFVFLLPKSYPRLQEKFKKELKQGATVIAEAWPLPDFTPNQILRGDGELKFYVYQF